ncbi:MAG: hypothetical protein ABSF69_27375 [Polyangiaceae bacterium]
MASIADPVDAPLAGPDVPAEPLVAPEEGVPAEAPDDDPDPELPEEGPLLLLLLQAQKTVATIDKATGRLRALDMVVTLREKARLSVPTERGRRIG